MFGSREVLTRPRANAMVPSEPEVVPKSFQARLVREQQLLGIQVQWFENINALAITGPLGIAYLYI